jgi:nuclear GTP-binding protein
MSEKIFFRETNKINRDSRRVIFEVKKVFSTCQIIFFILDARNPIGTWPSFLNKKDKYKSKKILIILNKCDLVPVDVAEKWIKIISKQFLVFSFFCKKKNETEQKKIISVLRQIKKQFFKEKKKIHAGVIGYPNVGKSSFINSLIGKKSLRESCVAGETKTWQFIKLTKDIFLTDSPGSISGEELSGEWGILKGTIKIEKIGEIKKEILQNLFKIIGKSKEKRLKHLHQKKGLLIRGGKQNYILNNHIIFKAFLSGKLPWCSPIPEKKGSVNKILFINTWKTTLFSTKPV